MLLARRSFFALLGYAMRGMLGATLASRLCGEARAAGSSRTLAAYLDTLIPDDEVSPGALGLGVLEPIEARAAESADYSRLVELGCRWLDKQAQHFGAKDFAALGESERERIVFTTSQLKKGTLARLFFERTREDAFRIYWAKPEAWAGLGYNGPPQPEGFPDYSGRPSGA